MKKTIVVLFGGKSTEYSVSLQSGYAVITNIDKQRYTILPIGITKEGKWFSYTGNEENIPNDTWWKDKSHLQEVIIIPDPTIHALSIQGRTIPVDFAFPVLHGINGEDGSVQGLFQLAGIPVIGCGILASALCMDKKTAHQLVEATGILCAKSILIHSNKEIPNDLAFPLYVKPVHAGSSIGIQRVTNQTMLYQAVQNAFSIDNEVLLEEEIQGFEVGCAIIGNEKCIVGRVDEIELSSGFFDYTEKYTLKTSKIHMPARISQSEEKRIQETALKIYHTLKCTGFARVDMFYTPEHKIYFNEINTIPGFTSHSRFPNMMKGIHYTFPQIIQTILEEYDHD